MELVQLITENLGVDQGQAEGGLGLILKHAKEKLAAGDFSKVADLIPRRIRIGREITGKFRWSNGSHWGADIRIGRSGRQSGLISRTKAFYAFSCPRRMLNEL